MVTPTETRFGRTALIVLAISLSMYGALLALERFGPKDEYDQGVLKILAITVGVVGSAWAFVLLVRGVTRGEPMVLPFAIFLIVFAGLSIPLIQTWDTKRGGENGWYFFHFACVPLIVPLLTISFLFATPLFVWRYLRARDWDGRRRSELQWRAWRTLFVIAGVLFAGVLPFAFYVYGGTMAESARGLHWTTNVVKRMPRWIGNYGYCVKHWFPKRASQNLLDLLFERGLMTPEYMIEIIRMRSLTGDQDAYYWLFATHYPAEAKVFVRSVFSPYPPTIKSGAMAIDFAKFASDSDVREYLTLERYDALTFAVKSGLDPGLLQRANAKDFVPDAEKLWGADEGLPRVALRLLMKHADDATAKRVYLEAIERKDESLQHATSFLVQLPRVGVIAAGISQTDMSKQQRVMQAVLVGQSNRPITLLMRIRNDPAYRLAILRAQDSIDIDNRVMNALIIHQLSNAMTVAIRQKYGKFNGAKLLVVTPADLRTVDLAERNVLIAQARDLMRKW